MAPRRIFRKLGWQAVVLGASVLAVMLDITYALLRGTAGDSSRADPVALGRSVYDQRCAICHGRNLEGQVNWKNRMANGRLPAPPHDSSGHTWHHPDRVLIGIIRDGLKPYAGADYESDMPAFGGSLTDEEILAVIDYIKSIWPEREREYQRRMTGQQR